jgi:threonine/homoserine/homoserine lactone efflux protein
MFPEGMTMSMEIWLAFTLAAIIILVIPGPTILLVMSQALTHGRRTVLPLTCGVVLGDFTAMVLSLVGLGAILAASAALFILLKGIGALYLFYLGIKMWRSKPGTPHLEVPKREVSGRTQFRRAYIVTALNPKGIVFFVAFMPQFVSHTAPVLPQLVIMGSTFLVLAGINATLYGLLAGQLQEAMQSPRVRKAFDIVGGSALIGAGALTGAMHVSS